MTAFVNHNLRATEHPKHGASLIEIMFAILILSIMAVGGAAYLQYSQAESYAQVARRFALETANTRLEELYKADYDAIKPTTLTYATHYVTGTPAAWTVSTTAPNETVNLNGIVVPIVTTVNYEDLDAAGDSYDYLRVKVEVAYRANHDAKVRQEVFIEP